MHLPTHETQFYDVKRYEFIGELKGETYGQANVMMCVEGEAVYVVTDHNGVQSKFSYG